MEKYVLHGREGKDCGYLTASNDFTFIPEKAISFSSLQEAKDYLERITKNNPKMLIWVEAAP